MKKMTPIHKATLKPCPICGKPVKLFSFKDRGKNLAFWIKHDEAIVDKNGCGINFEIRNGYNGGPKERAEITKRWNRA
jgi:hypothetical protein